MLLKLSFQSKEIKKMTQVNVILPDETDPAGEPCTVLWLFHGLHGDHNSWMQESGIKKYAKAHRIAVVMPDADRSWYADTAYGANYFSIVTKELPELCRKTFASFSAERKYNLVGGLSMGGYGAVKAALTYPEQYAACISLSGSLDITRKNRVCDLELWKSNFGFDLQSPLELEGTAHDLFALARKNCEEGKALPKTYIWCGLEDSLLPVNQEFHQLLTSLGVDHTYEESTGNHSWKWWDLHIQSGLNCLLGEK